MGFSRAGTAIRKYRGVVPLADPLYGVLSYSIEYGLLTCVCIEDCIEDELVRFLFGYIYDSPFSIDVQTEVFRVFSFFLFVVRPESNNDLDILTHFIISKIEKNLFFR
jgi:hypothetical protein